MNGPSGSAGTAGDGYRVIPQPRERGDAGTYDDPAEPGARRTRPARSTATRERP